MTAAAAAHRHGMVVLACSGVRAAPVALLLKTTNYVGQNFLVRSLEELKTSKFAFKII